MTETMDEKSLTALKIAFCYMPKASEVNKYDHGDKVDKMLAEIEKVREVLLINGVDPDEVYDENNPDEANNSCY
jgi:hypothetical protein